MMKDKNKTKEQLVKELAELQQRVAELENAVADQNWIDRAAAPESAGEERSKAYAPAYGDLAELNTSRVILDSVGAGLLAEIASDYLDLLGTSGAIYEANGDYASGIFSSGWCQFLDKASYKLCGTDDSTQALNCGKWLCHESCWNEASKPSIETGKPVDIECSGGIRLYAVPIWAGTEIVGSMNFGHGNPLKDPEKLQEIAEKYGVTEDELREAAKLHPPCSSFVIDIAKSRLLTSAKLVGEITRRRRAEDELKESSAELRKMVNLMAGREVRMTELKEAIGRLRVQIEETGMVPVADDPLKEDRSEE